MAWLSETEVVIAATLEPSAEGHQPSQQASDTLADAPASILRILAVPMGSTQQLTPGMLLILNQSIPPALNLLWKVRAPQALRTQLASRAAPAFLLITCLL